MAVYTLQYNVACIIFPLDSAGLENDGSFVTEETLG